MVLSTSNTYIEPVAGASLNIARGYFNSSLRALLANFKSTARPSGNNIVAGGTNLGEVDGMLFRSELTNALYISDSVHVKSSPVGGNFTRVGIGNRVENGIAALAANSTSYEIGEMVATVSESPSLSGNARVYLCVSNTATAGSTSNFVDIGIPQGYSIGTNDNVTFSGQSVTAIRYLATSNVGINTTSPAYRLDVSGDSRSTGNMYVGGSILHDGDPNTYFGFPTTDEFRIFTNGSDRLHIYSNGYIGIGTTSPTAPLTVAGDIRTQSTGTGATISIKSASANTYVGRLQFGDDYSDTAGQITYNHTNKRLALYSNAVSAWRTSDTLTENFLQTTFTHSTSGEATVKIIRSVNDTANTPAIIVANDGEASDIIAEFRANALATPDSADAPYSSDMVAQIRGNGDIYAKGNVIIGQGVTFPDATTQSSAGLGYNQTLQNVIASRSVATSYQNTTGRPIVVTIDSRGGAGTGFTWSADGVTWEWYMYYESGAGPYERQATSITIPPNYYYQANGDIRNWTELR